ncbi:MAG: FHA domain-containing protein [Clostridia bacterium]|nr:FHA domain-containing protein [Clostridia bacterium]
MSIYSLISSLLSYVFTTIIYLFIFSVIALIYMDIKKTNRGEEYIDDPDNELEELEDEDEEDEEQRTVKYIPPSAKLRTIKTRESIESKMKASYKIGEKGAIIGRGKDCDISIQDMYLSVEHFQIWHEDGIWYIGDMGSKNGTFLNEIRVKKVKTLHDGDEISFGGLRVIFEED